MARRALRLASWTSMALAASGFYLYSNKYLDPNDFGAVRVGRAVATVGFSHFRDGKGTTILLAGVHTRGRWTRWAHMCEGPCVPLHVQSSLSRVAQAWVCTLMHLYFCMHNLCHPEVKWSRIAWGLCSEALHFRFRILFS